MSCEESEANGHVLMCSVVAAADFRHMLLCCPMSSNKQLCLSTAVIMRHCTYPVAAVILWHVQLCASSICHIVGHSVSTSCEQLHLGRCLPYQIVTYAVFICHTLDAYLFDVSFMLHQLHNSTVSCCWLSSGGISFHMSLPIERIAEHASHCLSVSLLAAECWVHFV